MLFGWQLLVATLRQAQDDYFRGWMTILWAADVSSAPLEQYRQEPTINGGAPVALMCRSVTRLLGVVLTI